MLPIKITQMNTLEKIACVLIGMTMGAFVPITVTSIVWMATLGQAFSYLDPLDEPFTMVATVLCLIIGGCAAGSVIESSGNQ